MSGGFGSWDLGWVWAENRAGGAGWLLQFLADPGCPVPGPVMYGGKAATGAKSSVPAVASAGPTLTRRDKALLSRPCSSGALGAVASPPFFPLQYSLKDEERNWTAPASDELFYMLIVNKSL